MKQPPCYNCPDRHELCHANCGKYAEYRDERNAVNVARSKHILQEEYFIGSSYKTAKAANRR